MIKTSERSVLFTMPQTSDFKGYSLFVPAVFVSEDKEKEDGAFKISVPETFVFKTRNNEKEELKMSAWQMFDLMKEKTSADFKSEQTAQKTEGATILKNENSTTWLSAALDKAAVIAKYENRSLIKMPSGDYGDYVYYIPNEFLKEKDGSLTIGIPNNFVVNLVNNRAGKEEERKVEMKAEDFIAKIEGKTEGDYSYLKKPGETRADKFSETGARLDKALPEEMKKRPNWVIVRTRKNDNGKIDKFLISPVTGKFAESDNSKTWTDYETACKYAKENGGVALAYALDGKDKIACIDLDGCIDENGQYTPLANEVLSKAGNTYVEKSLSGRGLHIFGKTDGMDVRSFSKDGDMEFYQKSQFISMTGDNAATKELASFDTEKMKGLIEGKCERRTAWNGAGIGIDGISRMTDRDVVDKAIESKNGETFKSYYNGEDLKKNHSNSDMALMNMLAFWCNGDKEQMLRIFATSGLYCPDKSPDYYEHTAIKAVRDTSERFQPKRQTPIVQKSAANNSDKGGK